MVGKSKNGGRTFLKFSTAPSPSSKHKKKHSSSLNRIENCHIFADSCWGVILACFLLAEGYYLGFSPQLSKQELFGGYLITCGHFPAAFLYPFNSAHGCPIAF
jgi:hypothetical protein